MSLLSFGKVPRLPPHAIGFLGALVLLTAPFTAQAQYCSGTDPGFDIRGCVPPPPKEPNTTARYAATIGANVALGGLTGGIGAQRSGGSFWRGFLHGAAGGGITLAGKQVGAARFSGAGLLGRQVAAVGGSVVNNTAAGRAPLARLIVPLGPLRAYVEPGGSRPVHVKVDAAHLVGMGYALTRPGARLEFGASLSSGAPVVRVGDEWGHRAAHVAGVVLMTDHAIAREGRYALAHERVHVTQYDFAFAAWSQPAESWAAERSGSLGRLNRYVDFSANAAFFGALTYVVPSRVSPWEEEAYLLSDTK